MGSHGVASVGCLAAATVAACAAPGEPPLAVTQQAATACGDGPTVQGMDVSDYEVSVDWDQARAAGIEFAFIRATDGTQYIDTKFSQYWAAAKAAGVIRGTYQFFRPAEDPIAQADLLLSRMGQVEPGELPPVIDVEVNGGLAPAQVAASVRAWVDHVTQKIGRPPIVYAGLYSWADLTGSADLTTSPLWVAQYTTAPCPDIPAPWKRWQFWQHSSMGAVPGIPGATLDVNWFNGTLEQLRQATAGGSCGDGVCSGAETADSCALDCAPCGVIGRDGGTIDDADACFVGGGPPQYLRQATDAGQGGELIWTYATPSANEVSYGQWNLFFQDAGRYRVEVYTAAAYASSTQAAYAIDAAGAHTTVVLDQTAVDGWQALGEFDFAAGGAQSIHLGDNTGELPATYKVVFDAVRLTRIDTGGPGNGSADPGDGTMNGAGSAATPTPGFASSGCSAGGASGSVLAFALIALGRFRSRTRREAKRRAPMRSLAPR